MAVSVQAAPPVLAAPPIAEPIVEAIGVDKTYDTGTVQVRALRAVDLTVGRGEMVAIMGRCSSHACAQATPGAALSRRSTWSGLSTGRRMSRMSSPAASASA